MTLETLRELMEDQEFRSIPSMIANQKNIGNPWWRVLDDLKTEGAKATIWEGCQWIALLFDTYGDNIEKVSINLNVDIDGSEMYMTSSVHINDGQCWEDEFHLDYAVLDACEAIDGKEALNQASHTLDIIGNSNLLSEMDELEKAFKDDFTSAKQARDMAKTFAPDINKWFVAKMLEAQVQDKIQERINKSRGPKI